MCSETSLPRLSFHLILVQDHHHQPRRDTSLLDLNCEFEFSISTCSEQESSSADELFSHGVILPIQPRESISIFLQTKHKTEKPHISILFLLSHVLRIQRKKSLRKSQF
ncbi:hypothetical protein PanWU01x14_011700 [Parasponia andersonii]|uniref:Uncharacterized protein n=1 Tax=Parasponia andersonii TaxID=3476 RepID=A0A2P5E1L5_PARAD|nr:hypothetical protein PanWU01x14_011700 [Parasponia andersonii]